MTNVRFEQADAQVHPFGDEVFDIVISVYGAMFFADPTAAFANIRGALRPGGRLALLAWRDLARNEWVAALRSALAVGRSLPEPSPGLPGPFGLADAGHVRLVLDQAGFVDVCFAEIDDPIEYGSDADDAFAFLQTFGMVKGLTQDLDDEARGHALEALHRALVEHETDTGVLFGSSAWLVTARVPHPPTSQRPNVDR